MEQTSADDYHYIRQKSLEGEESGRRNPSEKAVAVPQENALTCYWMNPHSSRLMLS